MRRLIISLIVVSLVATIGLGLVFDKVVAQYFISHTKADNDAISELEVLGEHLAKTLNQVAEPKEFVENWPVADSHQLSLISANKPLLPQALLNELDHGKSVMLETDSGLSLYFLLKNHQQLLVLQAPPLTSHAIDSSLRIILTSAFYLLMMLLMLAWLYPLLRRLLKLRQVAKAFGEGDLSQRVNVSSVTYIRDLETEFNHMAQRISDNVDEMVELVETLLNYARLDQAMVNLEKQQVAIRPIIDSCIKNKASDQISITVTGESDTTVYGDSAYLMILINNLLQNAVNYGEREVIVDISSKNEQVVISVSDDGNGIASEDREQIIKPFIRGNDSEQTVKGYGMGLAIVSRILQWYQGHLAISHCEKLGGAKFSITLPPQAI